MVATITTVAILLLAPHLPAPASSPWGQGNRGISRMAMIQVHARAEGPTNPQERSHAPESVEEMHFC